MNLKQARAIARKVGATIEPDKNPANGFKVRIHVPTDGPSLIFCATERDAAHSAVIETAKAAYALAQLAKQVYVDENLLFDGGSDAQ